MRMCFERANSKTVWRVVAAVAISLALYSWADVYVKGQTQEAIEHLKRGFALFNSMQYDAAIAEYREAIRLDPKLSIAHSNLGTALDREHKSNEAVAEFREALRLDPRNLFAHMNLGDDLRLAGDWDGALAQYNEAAKIKPDSALAHNNVGAVLFQKGALGEALEQFKTAVRLDPKLANAHINMAWALHRTGDPQGALAECRQALQIAPNDPTIREGCDHLRERIGTHPPKSRNSTSTRFLYTRTFPRLFWDGVGSLSSETVQLVRLRWGV